MHVKGAQGCVPRRCMKRRFLLVQPRADVHDCFWQAAIGSAICCLAVREHVSPPQQLAPCGHQASQTSPERSSLHTALLWPDLTERVCNEPAVQIMPGVTDMEVLETVALAVKLSHAAKDAQPRLARALRRRLCQVCGDCTPCGSLTSSALCRRTPAAAPTCTAQHPNLHPCSSKDLGSDRPQTLCRLSDERGQALLLCTAHATSDPASKFCTCAGIGAGWGACSALVASHCPNL